MNRFVRWTTLASTLGLLTLSGLARADEEEIPVNRLPKAVLKAVKAKFPKAEIEEAAKEEEDGKTIYEVSLELDERSIDVSLTPSGKILEIEKEVPVDELPRAVKKALAAKYPKAKIKKVEEVTEGEDGPVRYEVVLEAEVVLSAKGKVIKADDDDDDDEDGDDDDDDDDDDHEKRPGKARESKKK